MAAKQAGQRRLFLLRLSGARSIRDVRDCLPVVPVPVFNETGRHTPEFGFSCCSCHNPACCHNPPRNGAVAPLAPYRPRPYRLRDCKGLQLFGAFAGRRRTDGNHHRSIVAQSQRTRRGGHFHGDGRTDERDRHADGQRRVHHRRRNAACRCAGRFGQSHADALRSDDRHAYDPGVLWRWTRCS